jgi:WD40 repeat protein
MSTSFAVLFRYYVAMTKHSFRLVMLIFGLGLSATTNRARQQTPPSVDQPLILTAAISMPNVQGRIDHFALDPAGRIFVCVVGNDTAEVLETLTEKRIHTITGIPHPQGAAFSPEFNKLFVASRDGQLFIYDGSSFNLITSIDFHDDVDNLRYDSRSQRLFVGFGDAETAAIGVVDAATNQRLSREFKLGAHPESFQLETAGTRIFVNLPDLKQIAVIDRNSGSITKWPFTQFEGIFPMALDETDHRLLVATRTPPRFVVLDTESGRIISTLRCAADSDDLYYDAIYKRIYIAGGQGLVSVFAQRDPNRYELLADIPSALGARSAGYAAKIGKKGRDRFYLGVPARSGHDAEVWVYQAEE